jgi:hypothetical protein
MRLSVLLGAGLHQRGRLLRGLLGPVHAVNARADRHAGRLWAQRAAVEASAAVRFARLATELAEHDAVSAVIELAGRAAEDERRHHVLCHDLAREFGVDASAHAVPDAGPIAGPLDARARLLCEVVAMSCITESLSAALLLEMREQARSARVRDVVHEVLRDEINHAKLGWGHLATEAGRGDVGWLAPRIPAMFAGTVDEELFGDPEPDVELAQAVAARGGLTRRTRCEVFATTMAQVVLPGLARFGVDPRPGQTWLEDKLRGVSGRPEAAAVAKLVDV